jgi:prepilin-type processing-associated H-X9-DG protein
VTEFDIFDDRGETVNIQFGDGSVAYGVPKALYEVVEAD